MWMKLNGSMDDSQLEACSASPSPPLLLSSSLIVIIPWVRREGGREQRQVPLSPVELLLCGFREDSCCVSHPLQCWPSCARALRVCFGQAAAELSCCWFQPQLFAAALLLSSGTVHSSFPHVSSAFFTSSFSFTWISFPFVRFSSDSLAVRFVEVVCASVLLVMLRVGNSEVNFQTWQWEFGKAETTIG